MIPQEQSSGGSTSEHSEETAPKPAGRDRKKSKRRLLLAAVAAVALASSALGGFLVGRSGDRKEVHTRDGDAPAEEVTTWYCSMHPQITSPQQGKCAICFMDLIPLEEGAKAGPRQLKMTPEAMKLAEIQTTPVKRQVVTHRVRMVGKIEYDETRLAAISAWIPGRLDRLYVDYTGISVRKGDHLVYMYSPELVVAQHELLNALDQVRGATGERSKEMAQLTLKSTEEKLRLWGLLEKQIEEIKSRGEHNDHMTIYAPTGGIVIRKHANEGDYVQTGTKIYTIADLSRVWALFDAYESDVPWLRYGQEVEFSTDSYPGEAFKGKIAFVDPVLDEKTRTVKVRANIPNEDSRLKPGMFIHATVKSQLAEGGRVLDAALAGKWISPMHPEVVKDGPGKCDVCGMDLVPAEELGFVAPEKAARPSLVIPAFAPLITGKRAVVYVRLPDSDEPTFEGRDVLLGHRAGDYYIVRHGLDEGELVVTKGNFKIDSALQIKAEPSMMSPQHSAMVAATAEGTAEGHSKALDVSADFRVALSPAYQAYLASISALANDDLAASKKSLGALVEAVDQINPDSISEEARLRLRGIRSRILFAAYEALDAPSRLVVRKYIRELSLAMVELVHSFGHALPDAFVQIHCPMAFGGLGADWIQLGETIRNPYFGSEMLDCGTRVASFESQAPLEVSDSFRLQLARVYDPYLRLQEALADDRFPDATSAWDAMRLAVSSIPSEGLDPRTLRAWHATLIELEHNLNPEWEEPSIDDVRKHFEALSGTMLALADAFGHSRSTPLYRAYCPMAFKNKGAAWLQAGEKIANPYFGHKMLRCGEVQRSFAAAGLNKSEEGDL